MGGTVARAADAIAELREQAAERLPDANVDIDERLAAGRPGSWRVLSPGGEALAQRSLRSRWPGGPPSRPGRSRGTGIGDERDVPRRTRTVPRSPWRRPRPSCRPRERRMEDPRGGPAGNGRAGTVVRSRQARRGQLGLALAHRRQGRIAPGPGSGCRDDEPDSPWRSRTRVASRPSGMSGPGGDAGTAISSAIPSQPDVQRSMTESWRGSFPRAAGETSSSRARIISASARGALRADVHRADVHVGLAEDLADPPDHPRPVTVVGDQHHVGQLDVEPVVVEAGQAQLAAGDGPGDGRGPAADLAGDGDLAAYGAGSGVFRSTTVIPRSLARSDRVDEVHPLGRRGLDHAAEDGRGQRRRVEGRPGSPAISSVMVRTPLRANWTKKLAEHLGERQVGRDRPGRLGREERGVHRIARRPAGKDVEDLVGDLLRDERPGPPRSRRRGAASRACSVRRAGATRPGARTRRHRYRHRRDARRGAPRRRQPRRGSRRGRR